LWRNVVNEDSGETHVDAAPASEDLRRALHRCIDGVRADMEALRFNTAIAKLIELNNVLTPYVAEHGACPQEVATPLAKMLAPLCPHMAEELWRRLGNPGTITYEDFPTADASLLASDTIEIPVQINEPRGTSSGCNGRHQSSRTPCWNHAKKGNYRSWTPGELRFVALQPAISAPRDLVEILSLKYSQS
jgi:leucyl-tRNA synthetase